MNKYPTPDKAIELLDEAKLLSSGFWIEHSKMTAKATKLIALECKDMDSDKAFSFGLLHDIGRRFQKSVQVGKKHTINGYNYMMDLGTMMSQKFA